MEDILDQLNQNSADRSQRKGTDEGREIRKIKLDKRRHERQRDLKHLKHKGCGGKHPDPGNRSDSEAACFCLFQSVLCCVCHCSFLLFFECLLSVPPVKNSEEESPGYCYPGRMTSMLTAVCRLLLSSRLYCRFRNCTGSAAFGSFKNPLQFADYTAGREFRSRGHPAPKYDLRSAFTDMCRQIFYNSYYTPVPMFVNRGNRFCFTGITKGPVP